MTPFETVLQHYRFPEKIGDNPFVPHPLQIQAINDLAPLPGQGHWHGMGTGKTFIATAVALFHKITWGHSCIVIMPPLLLKQWQRWLKLIEPQLRVTVYAGTPAQRKALSLDADFVLVGVQIFKKERHLFIDHFKGRPFTLIVDEASQSLTSTASKSHQDVYDFHIGHPVLLLTGTPATNPLHAYAMLKFVAPGTYRNKKQFETVHVEERDFFGNPSRFCNLDLLAENLKKNSARILFEDMYKVTDPPMYAPLSYDLATEHYKLYRKLADEELLKLDDGKIDATDANRLFHALGQIVVNWGHFASNPKLISNALYMVEEKIEELGGGKMLVFCHYRMTAALLQSYFGARCAGVINGDATPKAREKATDRFLDERKAQVLVLQAKSGGFGLDGLQHVCNTAFFIEPTQQPGTFHQAVARLYRTGQRSRVQVYLGIADGTLQNRAFRNLLKNDDVANTVIRNVTDLRAAIFGE